MLSALLTLFVIGIIGMVAVTVVMTLVGVVLSVTFGVAGFLLFKVLPLLLVGWVVLKLVERSRKGGSIAAADQKWLDS